MADERQHLVPIHIPDHRLIRRIGRGSYGEVWLAQTMMGTYRAVKLVHRQAFDHERPFERELAGIQRFEPISRSHDGLIDILQVGQNPEQGYFYYVMELGDAEDGGEQVDPEQYRPNTLARKLAREGMLPIPECVRIGLGLTSALAHLHHHGLIHRDIKPSNIIFVHGQPKLVDIGLVAEIKEAPSYVGTEGFIPPEGPGSAQADVYSLGKVLYESSTGKDRNEFPQLPVQFGEIPDPTPFLELNEVIVKACQSDRQKRYRSADDMHADLRLLEHGKSVKRLRLLERRWAKATRIAIAGAISLAAAGAVYHQVERQRQRAAEARQRQVGAQVAYGTQAMDSGDLSAALPYLAEALRWEESAGVAALTHRLRLAAVLGQVPRLVRMWFSDKPVNVVEFSPDGERILTALLGGKSQVWNARTGQPISPAFGQQSQALETASFSPDGRRVVTASADKMARVWDAAAGTNLFELRHSSRVNCAKFSRHGQRVVTAANDGKARVWDASNGQLLLEIGSHQDIVRYACFSPDDRLILTASQDGSARLWEAKTAQSVGPPLLHKSWVFHACFSPDGERIVTASFDRKARVWETATGREILPAMGHGDAVHSAEFSPDGAYILTACWDGTARLWDAETHQPLDLNSILKHSGRVLHAAFHPAGHRIATGSTDGTTRLWELAPRAAAPRLVQGPLHLESACFLLHSNNWVQPRDASLRGAAYPRLFADGYVTEAALSRNGKFALAISAPPGRPGEGQPKLQIWDVSRGQALWPALPCTNRLVHLGISDDGRRLVLLAGKVAQAYDLSNGRALGPALAHDRPIVEAMFSAEGSRLLVIAGRAVCVWEPLTGRLLFPALRHAGRVGHAQFSPDGRVLVSCATDEYWTPHAAQIWNAATGEPVGRPLQHGDGVLHASFSADSQRVVTASEDFTAVVWDARTGEALTPPLRHEDQVKQGSFSRNGCWIVTACRDKTARVWDAQTGQPLTPPLRHPSPLRCAAFIDNDERLLTSDGEGSAWLWELSREDRPVSDLVLLARVLAPGAEARVTVHDGNQLRLAWQTLTAAYPYQFAVQPDEILAWHRGQAELREEKQQWSSALFHLDRLLALRADDPALAERRARVQAELARDQATPNGASN